MRGSHPNSVRRQAFTLVELLVVISIVLILSTLAILFVPSINERAKTNRGGDNLQQWFLVSRQWAKKDRVPTGLRLQSATGSPRITDLQYIQQPPDFVVVGSTISPSVMGPNNSRAKITGGGAPVDLFNGNPGNQPLWFVQPGDYLEIRGGGAIHHIDNVVASSGTLGDTMLLTPANPIGNFAPTSQYRIIRAPRVLPGEQAQKLPQDVAIDLNLSQPNTPLDVLFSPSGAVLGSGAANEKLIFWVRDVAQDGLLGDQTLIVVNTRTGFIQAQSVDSSAPTTCTAYTPNPVPRVTLAASVQAGTTLVLDAGGSNPEVVTAQSSGTTVQISQPVNPHTAPFIVWVDPYSFTRNARGSGL